METAFIKNQKKSLFQTDSKGLHYALDTPTHYPSAIKEQCEWTESLAIPQASPLDYFILFLMWGDGFCLKENLWLSLWKSHQKSLPMLYIASVHCLGRSLIASWISWIPRKVLTHFVFPLPVLRALLDRQSCGHFK